MGLPRIVVLKLCFPCEWIYTETLLEARCHPYSAQETLYLSYEFSLKATQTIKAI